MKRALSVELSMSGLALLFAISTPSCYPPDSPAQPDSPESPSPATATSCPPVGQTAKATVNPPASTSETSSISVGSAARAYLENGTPWCASDVTSLALRPVNLADLTPCPLNSCLAVLNVQPDNIRFPKTENLVTDRPVLSYDLSAHPPTLKPSDCGEGELCYGIYQYDVQHQWCLTEDYASSPWCFVGGAKPVDANGVIVAQGSIHHFSIFALVELPSPTQIISPRTLAMYVISEFAEPDPSEVAVAVAIRDDDQAALNQDGLQHLVRFAGIDPKGLIGDQNLATQCRELPGLDQILTCMFPPGTGVQLDVATDPSGLSSVTLNALELGLTVEFLMTNVQVY